MINGYDFEDVSSYNYECSDCKRVIPSGLSYVVNSLAEIDICINPEFEPNRRYYCLFCGEKRLLYVVEKVKQMLEDIRRWQKAIEREA